LSLQTKQKKFRRLFGRDIRKPKGIVLQLKNALNNMNGTSSLTLVSLDYRRSLYVDRCQSKPQTLATDKGGGEVVAEL
jgi:hypothetical protein